jgi:hypothetical protein
VHDNRAINTVLVNARNAYAITTISTLNTFVAFLTLITFDSCWALLTVITPWTLRSLRAGLTHWALLTLRPSNPFNVTYLSPCYFGTNKIQDLN